MPFKRFAGLIALVLLLAACSSLRYYAHVAHGQYEILHESEPLDEAIAAADAPTAARLELARQARRFATQKLGLPDDGSYASYADLHRPFVVWNVFAAPRHSVDPVLHCFPFAGCVPYRGWFDETLAKDDAARLRAQGDDVYLGGVPAYSTLGWFADPILSTMLRWDDDELAGTIFHELAHRLIYVKDDTAFDESFASFVQRQGLRQWRASRAPDADERAPDETRQRFDDEFAGLVLDLRERLRKLYASALPDAAMDRAKQREFDDFRTRYRAWRDAHWPGEHRYDAFVAAPLNNASLLPFGLYDQWVPAFANLFKAAGNDWPAFYARVRALAKLPKAERERALDGLGQSGTAATPPRLQP